MSESRRWTQQHAEDFEMARELIGSLIAACAARLSAASDDTEAVELKREIQRYAAERRDLGVHDRDKISEVLSAYPNRLMALQEEPQTNERG
jgi:hypothetical protein